jgi:ribosome-associated protein
MDIKEAVKIAINAMEDKKATDIRVIDIAGISTLGDYFLIASGSNINQIHAITDEIEEKLGRAGMSPRQIEGYTNANWVLMDYGDIIIHVFDEENRLFYNLEKIWKDGKSVEIEEFK